jgi:HlyD family secretion protein
MVDGQVAHLSADATENKPQRGLFRRRLTCGSKLNAKRGRSHNTQQGAGQSAPPTAKSPNGQPYAYRALIDLKAQELIANGVRHAITPGMQVTAEIHLGTRTILEYLLSPVMGAFHEAGRER